MVQQEMGEHRIELGMPMQVKGNRSSVIIVMALDILQETVLKSKSVHKFWDSVGKDKDAVDDEHEVYSKVQPSDVIDTTSVHMGNSNVTPYEQYLSDNDIFGVPSCASSALNSVCVLSVNDVFLLHDPIATELEIYKEQVAIYEQRTKFELTEREQRMDDQMRNGIMSKSVIKRKKKNLKKGTSSFLSSYNLRSQSM
ncbi:hypothetical protein Tco_1132557 [Tanacetum coccineum]|uniref:Uncharacterized protein n=1 Tax=Tanacetum coccineum TaxID=301880 RepID=A0ABQ5JDB9_9ASTR